jgi:Arc/MetJ family transcription regulator
VLDPFSGQSQPQTGLLAVAAARHVYDRCMARIRTNIEIEETHLRAVMERFGVRTKTEAVDLALRNLAGQPMTREEALAMRGAHAIEHLPEEPLPASGE